MGGRGVHAGVAEQERGDDQQHQHGEGGGGEGDGQCERVEGGGGGGLGPRRRGCERERSEHGVKGIADLR